MWKTASSSSPCQTLSLTQTVKVVCKIYLCGRTCVEIHIICTDVHGTSSYIIISLNFMCVLLSKTLKRTSHLGDWLITSSVYLWGFLCVRSCGLQNNLSCVFSLFKGLIACYMQDTHSDTFQITTLAKVMESTWEQDLLIIFDIPVTQNGTFKLFSLLCF